jgi:branched-chain amino acid transport system substrate-binding protein
MNKTLLAALAGLTVVATACGSSGGSSPSSNAGTQPASAANSQAAPIVIAVPVQESGANAASNQPAAVAAAVWEKWTNAHGGIDGHPVKLNIFDTMANPAHTLTLLTQAINSGAVAIAGLMDPAVETVIQPVVDKAKIAVLGANDTAPVWEQDPNYYPLGTQYYPQGVTAETDLVKALGLKTFGSVVCAETSACAASKSIFQSQAAKLGLKFTATLTVSASQPDFTAQCLVLKSANDQFVDLTLASSTWGKLIPNCQLQNFSPTWYLPSSSFSSVALGLSSAKLVSVQPVFPYYADDSRTADFRAAFAQYGNSATPEVGSMMAWASLETLKAAIVKAGGKATVASVHAGLDDLNGYTAGGLLPQPLSFKAGKPSPVVSCYFVAGAQDGKYTLPQGVTATCPS